MKKIIVTTTINSPTYAILKYDEMRDWNLIVVGDLITPKDYSLRNGEYLSPTHQESFAPELSKIIGWNCIQRRNIGFLYALHCGADLVATIDDDNIPVPGWGENVLAGKTIKIPMYRSEEGIFDPLAVTNYPHLWHRGFPIQKLKNRKYIKMGDEEVKVDVEASFWNKDPDIDAICRMEHSLECKFNDDCFPFTSNGISPFNSQNTFLTAEALKEYYMFTEVGRMDDIWASYFLQSRGYKVVYSKASVIQERNPHDLTIDFEKEIIGYLNNPRLLESIRKEPMSIRSYISEKSWEGFNLYRKLASKY